MAADDGKAGREELGERVWDLWTSGRRQSEIARALDIPRGTVSRVIARRLRPGIEPTEVDAYRQAFVAQLDRLRAMVTEIVELPPPPAFTHHGVLLIDEHGRPVRDYTAKLAGARVVTQIIGQQAKILGVEAPARLDVAMSVSSATDAAEQAAQAAQAFLDQGNVVQGEVVDPGGDAGAGDG